LRVPSHFYFEVADVLTRLSRHKVIARTLVRHSLEMIRVRPLFRLGADGGYGEPETVGFGAELSAGALRLVLKALL
jgi:hypothetical protein